MTPPRNSFGTTRGCERHNKVDCDVCVSHGICDQCIERELSAFDGRPFYADTVKAIRQQMTLEQLAPLDPRD